MRVLLSCQVKLAIFLLLSLHAADYYPPPDSSGGWRTRPTDPRFHPVFEYIRTTTRHGGLVVVHKGWLIYERYFGRATRDATPNTASCGKMFTSVAMGIYMGEHPEQFPDGLDQRVFNAKYLPGAIGGPHTAAIRLGHLLSMTAGIWGNNPGIVRGRNVTLDPPGPDGWEAMRDETALSAGLWCKPGEGYSYATSSIHLVSMILRHLSGRELERHVEEKIARPLGWLRWGWGYKDRPLSHTPGGGGIAVRATDMLRFGYLLLKEGRWAGRQIIPLDYVSKLRTTSPYNPHTPYSLQFDVDPARGAFWKTGSGGHALYIIPKSDLVIWKLGGRDEQYSEKNTGIPEPPYDGSREGWQSTVDAGEAARRTLQMALAAVAARP